jgi:hypothetical protein
MQQEGLDMKTKDFFFFLFACGLSALLLPLLWPLFETNTDRVNALLPWGSGGGFVIFGLIVTALTVSIASPGLALRRITNKVPLWAWVLGWLGYGAVLAALLVVGSRVFGNRLSFVETALVTDPQLIWMNWSGLGGHKEYLYLLLGLGGSFITPVLCWVPGGLILAVYNRSPWFGLRFALAMGVGSLVSMLAAVLLAGFVPTASRHHFLQNGFDRFDSDDVWFLATAFLTATIGTIATLFVVIPNSSGAASQSRLTARSVKLGLGVGAACLVLPIVLAFITGPSGYRAGFPALQRLVSSSPNIDVVEGREVLIKHGVVQNLRTGIWPERSYSFVAFAPDSSHFIVADKDRSLVRVDIATGSTNKNFVRLPENTANPFEVTWSRDGRLLLLRTAVELPDDRFGLQGRKTTRVRLFSVPDYQQLHDQQIPFPCPVTVGSGGVLGAETQGSFLVRCESYDVPNNTIVKITAGETLRFEKVPGVADPQSNQIRQLIFSDVGPIAIRHVYGETAEPVTIQKLDGSGAVLALETMRQSDRAGRMTFQGLTFRHGAFEARFCGNPETVSNPPAQFRFPPPLRWFCRTLRYAVTGGFLGQEDEHQIDFQAGERRSLLATEQVKFVADWTIKSKTGTIRAQSRDGTSTWQTITTRSQTLAGVSPDGNWLVSHAFDDRQLMIYRINQAGLD